MNPLCVELVPAVGGTETWLTLGRPSPNASFERPAGIQGTFKTVSRGPFFYTGGPAHNTVTFVPRGVSHLAVGRPMDVPRATLFSFTIASGIFFHTFDH